jgi:hypothetical protein
MSLGLIIFKSSLINFRRFSVVYLNYIKRILAFVIKLLAYTKMLKNITLLSLIIHYLTSDSDLYWAHADYSLYTYGEKTPWSISPPFGTRLRVTCGTPTVGGYDLSLIGSHGAVCLSVCWSVGRSVGRNQSVGKQSVRREEKSVF